MQPMLILTFFLMCRPRQLQCFSEHEQLAGGPADALPQQQLHQQQLLALHQPVASLVLRGFGVQGLGLASQGQDCLGRRLADDHGLQQQRQQQYFLPRHPLHIRLASHL